MTEPACIRPEVANAIKLLNAALEQAVAESGFPADVPENTKVSTGLGYGVEFLAFLIATMAPKEEQEHIRTLMMDITVSRLKAAVQEIVGTIEVMDKLEGTEDVQVH